MLDAAIKAGTPVAEIYEYYQDWIYEIGLTPNRMDAMSHYGVAKDVCAYLSYHNSPVSAVSPFTQNLEHDKSVASFKVLIEDEKACARYSGLVIEGVTVQESPTWLKNRLQSIGLRSINNIVDSTNYILHETGQPLHAFDASEIKENKVVVKKYAAGTKFTTLDGVERSLQANDVMITDGVKPLCIAGVFGGLQSGVKATTKNIFLESAWFENVHIRKTSLHHGLRTDAATRFEKGVDVDGTVKVLLRAAKMIQDIAGGKCSEVVGKIGVDSGLIMIVDPCYLNDTMRWNPKKILEIAEEFEKKGEYEQAWNSRRMAKEKTELQNISSNWDQFCLDREIVKNQPRAYASGIVTPTRLGDGEYPVYITKDSDGRVKKMEIIF